MSELRKQCNDENLHFEDNFFIGAEEFCRLLMNWNQTHNITGAKSMIACFEHIMDSVAPLGFLPNFEKCGDIGAGAGFPGLALALAKPEAHFSLIEPNAKRYAFLHYACMKLDLKNVTIEPKRAEAVEQKFDLIVSRAVTNTKSLLELCRPLCAPHASLLFYKGEKLQSELVGVQGYEIISRKSRRYLFFKDAVC